MNRSPAEIRDRWLNYGRRYARYPTLWDSSLAFASGPLAPEAGTLRDQSGRTSGAAWSVGAGDVPKYVQWSVRGGSFWAGSYDGTDDYSSTSTFENLLSTIALTGFAFSCWLNYTSISISALMGARNSVAAANYISIVFNQNKAGTAETDQVNFLVRGSNSSHQVHYEWTLPSPRAGWHHYAFQIFGTSMQCWLDGRLLGVHDTGTNGAMDAVDLTYPILIGARGAAGTAGVFFAANIAASAMHRRVLTPAEISILARHPLAAYDVEIPRYWSFATTGGTHLWPWQIRRSRRMRGKR